MAEQKDLTDLLYRWRSYQTSRWSLRMERILQESWWTFQQNEDVRILGPPCMSGTAGSQCCQSPGSHMRSSSPLEHQLLQSGWSRRSSCSWWSRPGWDLTAACLLSWCCGWTLPGCRCCYRWCQRAGEPETVQTEEVTFKAHTQSWTSIFVRTATDIMSYPAPYSNSNHSN